jgi:hypothetical protein
MTLWQLLEAILIITNALAILNEDRFLAPNGWGFGEMGSGRVTTIKGQIVGLLHAVQYLRVPLVALNSIVIVMKVIFGWGCCLIRSCDEIVDDGGIPSFSYGNRAAHSSPKFLQALVTSRACDYHEQHQSVPWRKTGKMFFCTVVLFKQSGEHYKLLI